MIMYLVRVKNSETFYDKWNTPQLITGIPIYSKICT